MTAEVLGTTIASGGSAVNLLSAAMNVRVGYSFGPLPLESGFTVRNAETSSCG
jgi:hypothetical protein